MPLDTPTYVLEDQFEPVVYEILEAALTSVNKPFTDLWPSVWAVPRRTLFRLLKNMELLQWSLPHNYRILFTTHNIEDVRHKLSWRHVGPASILDPSALCALSPPARTYMNGHRRKPRRPASCHIFAITSVLHEPKPNAWGPEVLRVAVSGKGGTVYPAWARGTAVDRLCIN
ncbi:hypothetical protein CGMCC3_g18108 [Colletotrichum fructicola]|uniref:Uncharacterized protein n=1 Tax=Colletotrichum fructicola (strain Nara gc5) TaxID=1213859 RepID=A0A7J6IEU5_COLFN|nr:uncharacterized protein CGMCC3_g18108 [Colletotrichum fructicola]KAF4474403.1 hypothetical protein CGGC5_v016855 [Colletotrichum fructicola Nara gc5]KAE9565707.1 hypothetical protein CGMCC3_g18108 [Colletotrichum fructicola]KAF4415629.1 hypothetical protein CFRS1_v015993 [Colletotrichum fructicola]KAF4417233.1 hypothetical protein CFRS1_v015913 [Colletotrichum fructicola]KAF4417261.1 hypothetical protein CFRS1_v016022 [Colletotrichum fructicola]